MKRVNPIAWIALDPLLAAFIGVAAGLSAFSFVVSGLGSNQVGSSINWTLEAMFAVNADMYYDSLVRSLEVFWSHRYSNTFPGIAVIAAVIASYTLAFERDYGTSLSLLLVGVSRRAYLAAKLLFPAIAYSLAVTGGSVLGAVISDPVLALNRHEHLAVIASRSFSMAVFLAASCYSIALILRAAFKTLAVTLPLVLILHVSGAWKWLLTATPSSYLIVAVASTIVVLVLYAIAVSRMPLR